MASEAFIELKKRLENESPNLIQFAARLGFAASRKELSADEATALWRLCFERSYDSASYQAGFWNGMACVLLSVSSSLQAEDPSP